MRYSAQTDRFVHDRLPPPAQGPRLDYNLPELQLPAQVNLVQALFEGAARRGLADRPLLRSPRRTLSYAQAQLEVARIAQVLVQDHGLVPGNRVLLRGGNSIGMALAWLAVVQAGAVAVATMPLLRAKELGDIIDKAQPTLAICDERLLDELQIARAQQPVLQTLVSFDALHQSGELARAAAGYDGLHPACATAADDIALLAFTSGTTGKPKAAVHSHRDVLAACETWPRHVLRATPDDIVMGSPPLAFTFGLGGLLIFPMWAGASVYFPDIPYTPQAMAQLIFDTDATIVYTAPTFYRQMAPFMQEQAAQRGRPAALRLSVSAGEGLPDATRQLWKNATGLEMLDGIGATEMFHIFISAAPEQVRRGAIGTVVPGYSARVVGDDGQELPRGSVGRIAVIGPTGCRYLDDARQTNYVKDGWNYPGDAFCAGCGWLLFLPGPHRRHDHHLRLQRRRPRGGRRAAAPPGGGRVRCDRPERRGARHDRQSLLRAAPRCGGRRRAGAGAARPRQGQHRPLQIPARDRVSRQAAAHRNRQTATLQAQNHMKHLHPPGWVPAKGYANGVAARGTQIFVGGQIGWNAQQQFESDDFIAQTAQTLRNVLAVLAEGGAGPEHMARMTWYILDREEYNARLKELGQVYREVIGRHFPAMSCVQVAALMEARAKVEIEVTAVVPD